MCALKNAPLGAFWAWRCYLQGGQCKLVKSYLVSSMPSSKNYENPQTHSTRLRTICYVDGFNLYYGLRDSGFRRYYWLNVREMASKLVRLPFVLAQTKYFTARISGRHQGDTPEQESDRQVARLRQQTFLEALDTLNALTIHEGRFLLKRDYCRACKVNFYRPEEKMTDVQLATELVADAFLDRIDSAIVVSGDSDLAPAISAVRTHFPHKKIVVAFPPKRHSLELKEVASKTVKIWEATLKRSQLPESVTKPDGTVLRRPPEWA